MGYPPRVWVRVYPGYEKVSHKQTHTRHVGTGTGMAESTRGLPVTFTNSIQISNLCHLLGRTLETSGFACAIPYRQDLYTAIST